MSDNLDDLLVMAKRENEIVELRRLVEQLCRDLNGAHDEVLRQQHCDADKLQNYDWPEWTPQANSIRWAERLLNKRLAKTNAWTLFPAEATSGNPKA